MSAETEDSSVTDGREALRLCLDVNVLTADFLSRRKSGPLGSSSRILQMIADRRCALGTIQLVVSWRMLTTLQVILRRDFALGPAEAEAVADALAAFAEAGPDPTPPALILGGTGLLPMTEREDITVAEAALAGDADLLLTHDIDDFERGPKSRLKTRRLQTGPKRRAEAILLSGPLHPDLLIATPQAGIGWLLGQTPAPVDLMGYRRGAPTGIKPPGQV